eukprot:TRINITY_DN58740_c0_g1_i2.p2 TRINITY_DN58740_c0_g1~~TRINITY_DN58740_c0_g1_i2.p2  ORF type:complete len:174 (-),score=39.69 TRINITY_DN58740_c0_g1_i2:205-726(-)
MSDQAPPKQKLPGQFAIEDLSNENKLKKDMTIHEAAQKGMTKRIMIMVEKNIDFDINQRDHYGRTALHWAAEVGHIETAEALLDLGGDLSAVENSGRTAIHLAARHGNCEMLQSLLEDVEEEEKTRLVNQPDLYGITPIFLTREKTVQGEEAFQFLMINGAKYNQQDFRQSQS